MLLAIRPCSRPELLLLAMPLTMLVPFSTVRETFDYFRAVVHADERSERALELTREAIELNPANYTVWHFRRLVLFGLGKDLEQELDYVHLQSLENPKNYQIWYHRQCCVEKLGDPKGEMEAIEESLQEDSKNYHAWIYRQHLIAHFGLWGGELDYTAVLLKQDPLNNSAWNQRHFVLKKADTASVHRAAPDEVAFCLGHISSVTINQAAWNYLRIYMKELAVSSLNLTQLQVAGATALGPALLSGSGPRLPTDDQPAPAEDEDVDAALGRELRRAEAMVGFRQVALQVHKDNNGCVPALEFAMDMYAMLAEGCGTSSLSSMAGAERGEGIEPVQDSSRDGGQSEKALLANEALALVTNLVSLDPIRKKYYFLRKAQIEKILL